MKPYAGAFFILAWSIGPAASAKEPAPPSSERPWSPPRLNEYERELAGRSTREKYDTSPVYLPSAPEKKFRVAVKGISWVVKPEGEIDLPHGVADVKRELNLVHFAQRFPVRLEIESPDPELFRMGASVVVIIEGDDAR